MPYKNLEDKLNNAKKYYKLNRDELCMKSQKYRKLHPEKILEYRREYYRKWMNRLKNQWNNECCICGINKHSKQLLLFHEINWIKHNMDLAFYKDKDNFNRFILVCKTCHKLLHWLHELSGLELEEMPIWYSIRKGIKI